MTPALFLDRDGTLIEDPGYVSDPALVRLLPGVADALVRARDAGFLLVVVTNQSGIARGLVTSQQLDAVHERIAHLLAGHGAFIDAWAHCPHLPDADCECRKPHAGLHTALASALGIDLSASWCIGDRLSDLLPAQALGSRAILVTSGEGSAHREEAERLGFAVAPDLAAAIDGILGERR
ncbi:MAG: HAD family hydrolase [Gemmatimonadota bacterium]